MLPQRRRDKCPDCDSDESPWRDPLSDEEFSKAEPAEVRTVDNEGTKDFVIAGETRDNRKDFYRHNFTGGYNQGHRWRSTQMRAMVPWRSC